MNNLISTIIFLSLSTLAHTQVLLFDQTGNTGTGNLAAQDFETANDAYDCEIADDFIVPSGNNWYIDSIKLFGSYSAGAATNAGLKIAIWTNNSGNFGTLVFDTVITIDTDPDNNASLNAYFQEPLVLTPGTYWIIASAKKDFNNGGGQWYWGRESVGIGSAAKWRNPNDGFATGCTGWTAFASCSALNVTDPAVRFRIWGCYGPKPQVSLPGDTILCSDLVPVTIGTGTIQTGVIYYWNTGDTATSIVVNTTGNYTLYAYNPTTQCAGVASMNVTVHQTPHATLVNDTICQGQTKTFNGFAGCGTCIYEWNGVVGTAFYSTGVHGWHHLVITNPNSGCVGHDSVWLEVESTDPPVVAPNDENFICLGDTLYVYVVDPYHGYSWNTGASTQGIHVTQTGVYWVTVTTPNGCQGFSDTIYVTTQTAPTPTITVDYTAQWKTRLTASAGYQSYLWSTGSTDPVIIANSTGTYSLTVTDEFGCEGYKSIYVEVTGVSEILGSAVKVFPNPAKEVLHIQWPAEWVWQASIELCDVSGRVLKKLKATEADQMINVSHLSTGHYLLRIDSPIGQGAMHIQIE